MSKKLTLPSMFASPVSRSRTIVSLAASAPPPCFFTLASIADWSAPLAYPTENFSGLFLAVLLVSPGLLQLWFTVSKALARYDLMTVGDDVVTNWWLLM